MKFSKLLICFFLPVLLCACVQKSPANLWFYTHSLNNNNTEDTALTPASFLNLQRDGSYTRDFGLFDYGRWAIKENELVLTNQNNATNKIIVKYVGSKDLQLIRDKNVIANFEAQPTESTFINDPFSLANNRWRIRAKHKESEEEIKNRLINHCQFWASYFTWANENQLAVVDVRSTPTLIKIYGNGFSLKPYNELPAAWRAYFFDQEDCRIANNLLYEVLQYHDISWAHTDNKYKMFIGAFQQLKQYLR